MAYISPLVESILVDLLFNNSHPLPTLLAHAFELTALATLYMYNTVLEYYVPDE